MSSSVGSSNSLNSYSPEIYGYGRGTNSGSTKRPSKGTSVQEYLELFDLDDLPPEFGELMAATGHGSSYGGGYGSG